MKLEFTLSEADYVDFNLYVASKTESIRKRRQLTKWIIPVIYLLIAAYFLYKGYQLGAYIFLAIAVMWVFSYPGYEAKKYIKHFKKHIQLNLSKSLDKLVTMEFLDDHIFSIDGMKETKVRYEELTEIIETGKAFYLMIDVGHGFIIPKSKVDTQSVGDYFYKLSEDLQITYIEDLNWSWK